MSVCGQVSAQGFVWECVCLQVVLHREFYVRLHVCLWPSLGAGCRFSAGVGGQEGGGTLLRKSTHKALAGWPSFLPPFPGSSHSSLAPQVELVAGCKAALTA